MTNNIKAKVFDELFKLVNNDSVSLDHFWGIKDTIMSGQSQVNAARIGLIDQIEKITPPINEIQTNSDVTNYEILKQIREILNGDGK
jgi:hypothetical protein